MNYTLDFSDIELITERVALDISDVDLKTLITERYGLNIPIIHPPTTNIDAYKMALDMAKLGGVGCIHYFMEIDEQVDIVKRLSYDIYGDGFGGLIAEDWGVFDYDWHSELPYVPIMCQVELGKKGKERAKALTDAGCNIISIHLLNGHNEAVIDMVKWCKKNLDSKVDIIVGEITTEDGVIELLDEGVNGLLIGCSNSNGNNPLIKAGFTSSNITNLEKIDSITNIPIISIGKMNSIGNVSKALATGADSVMLDTFKLTHPNQFITTDWGSGLQYGASNTIKPTINEITKHLKFALQAANAVNLEEYIPEYNIVTNPNKIKLT